MIRRAAAIAALVLASQAPGPVHVGRAFTVRAEAFPVESAPGTR